MLFTPRLASPPLTNPQVNARYCRKSKDLVSLHRIGEPLPNKHRTAPIFIKKSRSTDLRSGFHCPCLEQIHYELKAKTDQRSTLLLWDTEYGPRCNHTALESPRKTLHSIPFWLAPRHSALSQAIHILPLWANQSWIRLNIAQENRSHQNCNKLKYKVTLHHTKMCIVPNHLPLHSHFTQGLVQPPLPSAA